MILYSCSTQECFITLEHSENNIVYYGNSNEIDISTKKGNCKRLRIEITNGQISKISDCKYLYKPEKIGFAKLFIYDTKKINSKPLETRILKVKSILDSTTLIAQINNQPNHSVISKKNLLAQYYISVKFNSKFNFMTINFRLKGYDAILFSRNSKRFYSNKGDLITPEFKSLINSLEEGDIIIFNNLEVEGLEKEIIKLTPYVIYIGN